MIWMQAIINNRLINYGINNPEKLTDCTKPVLFFIHGAASCSTDWLSVINFIPSYCSIVFDRPGFGNSQGEALCSIDSSVDIIYKLACKLKIINNIVLIGHSLGGYLSMCFAEKYSCSVHAAILISSFYKFKVSDEFLEQLDNGIYSQQNISLGFSKSTDKQLISEFSEHVKKSNIESIRNDFYMCRNLNMSTLLDKIKANTLIIVPMEDHVVSVRQGDYMNKKITNSKIVYIQNAGHNVIIEKPAEIASCIFQFIK